MPQDDWTAVVCPAVRDRQNDEDGFAAADGRGESVDIPAGKSFAELGAEMMVAAQEVVDDAEELMAMFPRAEARRVSVREATTGMGESSEMRTAQARRASRGHTGEADVEEDVCMEWNMSRGVRWKSRMPHVCLAHVWNIELTPGITPSTTHRAPPQTCAKTHDAGAHLAAYSSGYHPTHAE